LLVRFRLTSTGVFGKAWRRMIAVAEQEATEIDLSTPEVESVFAEKR
jgi:hypothetical protein